MANALILIFVSFITPLFLSTNNYEFSAVGSQNVYAGLGPDSGGGGGRGSATAGKGCSLFLDPLRDPIAYLSVGNILSVFITTLILISAIYALISTALGAFQYITSGGEKLQVEHARQRITYAILGLGVVVSVVAINQVLGAVYGINIFGTIKWPGAETIVGELGSCL